MATRYRLYSTDITATATPDDAATAPATLIAFDHDPIHSGGLQLTPPARRGSVIRTGGGVVYQDMGVVEGDGTLLVSGNTDEGEWLSQDTVDALRATYAATDTAYFLTDGLSVWRVRWQAMNVWRHQFWAEHGISNYSYEFTFTVVKTEIA